MASHPSHHLSDHGPVYSTVPQESTNLTQAYPSFSSSLHHVASSADRDLSGYGIISTPAEHHIVPSSHEQVQLSDADLPPARHLINRRYQPSASPNQTQHDFPSSAPDSTRTTGPSDPPPPPQIPNSAPSGHFDMQPPPASTHPSWQSLHEYAQSHASTHGYALSINTTAKNRSRIKLACVCYGAPKNTHKLTPETRVRKNRQSYKTGCKMWIEGKKMGDGLWALKVGEPNHNHPGRAVEGWAVQRKRTWGVHGGRVGVGGVTAMEENARLNSIDDGHVGKVDEGDNMQADHNEDPSAQSQKPSGDQLHDLEKGGLVWRIVEQEMLVLPRPSEGRDRGVGRTVKLLEERLPGIHIFKRDVYNIRAQIKRARKAANQPVGAGLDSSDNDEEADPTTSTTIKRHQQQQQQHAQRTIANYSSAQATLATRPTHSNNNTNDSDFSQIDPTLIAQCNSALKNIPPEQESEVERLRREVAELKQALAQRGKELEVKQGENEELRVQVEIANMALYNERSGSTH